MTSDAGPAPNDTSSKLWVYTSSVDRVASDHTGLIGAIIVTRAGQANADGTPKGVDRTLVTMLMVCALTDLYLVSQSKTPAFKCHAKCLTPMVLAGLPNPSPLITKHHCDSSDQLCQSCDNIPVPQTFDESKSLYAAHNNEIYGAGTTNGLTTEEYTQSLLKYSINGYTFCHLPGLGATQGDAVRWHFLALGNEVGIRPLKVL